MHKGDLDMLARGDLSAGRATSLKVRLAALVGPLFLGFGANERCTPSLTLEDGDSLAAYGLDARVLLLGGHSSGSLGLLVKSADGSGSDLFSGDLLANVDTPKLGWWLPDADAARAAIRRLRQQSIRTVYPGHGDPFLFDALLRELKLTT
jgi:glyoxylase-like metal-dependent hydrolase (beta-lactamase superfamily II)